MSNGERGRGNRRSKGRGRIGLEGSIGSCTVGNHFENIRGNKMKKMGDGQGYIGVRVLEGLDGCRLGNICTIQTKPYHHGLFIKIIDDELACEDHMIITCVLCEDLCGSRKEEASGAKRRVEGKGTSRREIGLCGGVLRGCVVSEHSSCALRASFTSWTTRTCSQWTGLTRLASRTRGAGWTTWTCSQRTGLTGWTGLARWARWTRCA